MKVRLKPLPIIVGHQGGYNKVPLFHREAQALLRVTSPSFILTSPAAIPQISALPVEKAAFAFWQSE